MNSKVSVLICTYNCENYIENTLNSVLDQTYKNYNILICENNSKDKTKNILKQFEKKHPKKIKVYYQSKNLGAYGGLNYLLDRTNSKYIAIQDHDDLWHPNKLEKQIGFLDKHNKFIGCGTGMINYYEKYKKYNYSNWNKQDYFANHSSLVFKNNIKHRYNTKINIYNDGYFMKYTLCKNKKKIYNLKNNYLLHIYTKNSTNLLEKWFKFKNYKILVKYNKIFNKKYNCMDKIKLIYNFIVPYNLRLKISIKIIHPKNYKNINELKNNMFKKYIK